MKNPKMKKYLIVTCIALAVAGCGDKAVPAASSAAAPVAETTASHQTEADVQARLIGVWTHTQPVSQDREPYGWERWAFTSGTVQIQSARPSDTQWSPPELYSYEITRKKTADTGQWYWHVHIKDTALRAAVTEDGNALVVFRIGADSNYLLRKEDKDLTK